MLLAGSGEISQRLHLPSECIVIDYRDLYDQMKDLPADEYEQLAIFCKLAEWKKNDEREWHNGR